MSPLFGKKSTPSTIAVLDIESGSVASGLVRVSASHAPHLLSQNRRALSVRGTPSAHLLLKEIERGVEEELMRLSSVTSRMRNHLGSNEGIDRVAVFLHAPWITVSLSEEKAKADAHDVTLEQLRRATRVLSDIPVTFHSFATTTTPIIHGLFNAPQESLVVTIGGEVAELSLVREGIITGYATAPAGLSTVLRTLEAHGGISRPEALSILSLSRSTQNHAWAEAITAGVGKVIQEFKNSAMPVLEHASGTQHIFVVAPHPAGDFFARMFTEDPSIHELFSPGSTIRAVSPKHASPHLGAHPVKPDVPLELEALFVDTRFGTTPAH